MTSIYFLDSEDSEKLQKRSRNFVKNFRPKHLNPRSKTAVHRAVRESDSNDVWIVGPEGVGLLLFEARFRQASAPKLILREKDTSARGLEILRNSFRNFIYLRDVKLPIGDLIEVLSSKNKADLIIGGEVSTEMNVALFYRGDFSRILVPLSIFPPSGDGIEPDFSLFSIEDHGQTIRFGEYEASVESVLYESDPQFRKRYKKKLIENKKGLGASIRRLRLQKQIRQTDFDGLDEKEIRRIESGEITKPHKSTLEKIAATLQVSVEELDSF